MSTDPLGTGGKEIARDMARQSAEAITARSTEWQPSMFDDPTPEDLARAQDELGGDASHLEVLDHARSAKASKGGRRKGSKNRASKDFARYILAQGYRDPALVMAEIQSTPAEVLVERSRAMDPVKQRLTYGAAQALRLRAAEGLMPFMHSKKPVQVDVGLDGDFNLLIPGLNVSQQDADRAAAGQFVLEADYSELHDDAEGDQ